MTQVGEGQEAAESPPPLLTFGAPSVGDILADRYRLEEDIAEDSVGRQVWRGSDVVLCRPVAVVLRHPGGESAAEMLTAAVAASRVVHPNLVGVYDAIDEGERAYVVREWVEGSSLRDHVAAGVFDSDRATTVAHAVAAAVAAVHETDMAHGNINPGSVLIDNDGRVVVADASADPTATKDADIRAVGGILYFALTGHWPHAELGASTLPDAVRDSDGTLVAAHQMRAGVPGPLNDLTMNLIDGGQPKPTAALLAAELGRLDSAGEDQFFDDGGTLRFTESEGATGTQPAGRKIALGIGALLVVALLGLIIGVNVLSGDPETGTPPDQQSLGTAGPGTSSGGPTAAPQPIAVTGDQVRIVDPPGGSRDELTGAAATVDGDPNTGWEPDRYNSPKFGNLKAGMGVLIDLGQPRYVTSVRVDFSARGASAELRTGAGDPGATAAGDKEIAETFTRIGEPFAQHDGSTMAFGGFDPDTQYQYLMLWITAMPQVPDGRYQVAVQEINVQGS